MPYLDSIRTPTLLLDKTRCLHNIQRMKSRAEANQVRLRPHFKTHQSLEIGQWFRHADMHSITVSSLQMARYFADEGWADITVAFPVNILEIDTINALARKCRLQLLVESVDTIHVLGQKLQHEVGIYIKVDVGTTRTGVHFSDIATHLTLVDAVNDAAQLQFVGLLAHAGHTYDKRSVAEVKDVYHQAMQGMLELKKAVSKRVGGCQISFGDTPGASMVERWDNIDEMRPGNFVFYDCMQVEIGSCDLGDIAVALACPVVSVHRDRNEIVTYGGAIHLGKDKLTLTGGAASFGVAVLLGEHGWDSNAVGRVDRISQEHGNIVLKPEFSNVFKAGDLIGILPVHSCMTAQCMGAYHMTDGSVADHFAAKIRTA